MNVRANRLTFTTATLRTIASLVILAGMNCLCVGQTMNVRGYSGIANTFARVTSDPIVLMNPGRFLDPVADYSDPDTAYLTSKEINRMLKPSLLYVGASNDLGDIYARILTQEQWAVLPLVPQQAEERRRLQNLLFNNDGSPKPGYRNYLAKKKAWEEIDEIYRNTAPDLITPELEAKHQLAQDEFELLFSRFGPSDNRLQQLNEQASLSWKDADIQQLAAFTVTSTGGNRYLATTTSPALDNQEELNWVAVTTSAMALRQTEQRPRFAGSIDASTLHWWRWSHNEDPSGSACEQDLDRGDFSVRFEFAVVPIKRDWLDGKVFASEAWRWRSGTNEVLSDGEIDNNQGLSPLFPTALVLVRSLSITGSGIAACLSPLRKAVFREHTVSFGPFTLAGRVESPAGHYLPPIVTRSAIHVVYPQALGYAVQVMPKTPNSNSAYVWPNN